MDLRFDIIDSVGRLDLEGDGFARKGLNEDLHDGLQLWCKIMQTDQGKNNMEAIASSPQQYCRPQPSAMMLDQQEKRKDAVESGNVVSLILV